MKNVEEFESLGWPEATLSCMKLDNNVFSFTMTDILSYAPKITYEYVKIKIEGINYFKMELTPYVNKEFIKKEYAINIGSPTVTEPPGFEGGMRENPFSSTEAEYYHVSTDFEAESVTIERTGEIFELQTSNK